MKKILLFSIALLMSIYIMGQSTANYAFSYAFTGSLVDISSGATTLLTGNKDDVASPVTNIGFTFYFMGLPYTQFSANSNGQIRLGSTTVGGSAISSYSLNVPILAPMGGDNEINNGMTCKVTGTAPNRVLVIEWNQFYVNYVNITGAGNMQALLYEGSGKIEYIYGEIYNSASSAQSRSIFISTSNTTTKSGSITVAATPTYESAATSPTSNSFAASVLIANLASTAQGSRTVYTFTPPAAPNPPTNLTFSPVTQTGMTLNWTDASNETNYLIYRSDDGGTTYNYITSIAANTTTYAATGLLPGVTYYWQVLSANEGSVSTALAGNQATSAAGTIVSAATGNWNAGATWVGGVVPTAADNVTIKNGHTVTINATGLTCYNLTVGEGTSGILRFGTTVATFTVNGSVIVAAGAIFDAGAAAGSDLTHTLNIGGNTAASVSLGNLTVNGTFDMYIGSSNGKATVVFYGTPNASVSGSGGTCDFNAVTLNKGATTASLTVTPPILEFQRTFTVQGGNTVGLVGTHTAGTLKIGGTYTLTTPLYSSASYTVPALGALWIDNPNFTATAQTGSPTLTGLLKISNGTYNVGTASGNSVQLSSNSSVIIEGGTINVAGRFAVSSSTNITNYNQSGGILNVCTVENTSTLYRSFDAGTSTSANFTMSGGTIVINKGTGATWLGGYDYRGPSLTSTRNITGGTLQLGSASNVTGCVYKVEGTAPTVVVFATNNPGVSHAATFEVRGDLTLNGTGTYTNNYTGLTISGNSASNPGNIVINAGSVFTINTSANQTLTFNSSFGNQSITNSGTITSNQLPSVTINNTFGGAGTVTIPSGLTLLGGGTLNLTKGTLNVGTGITLGTGATTGFTYIKGDGAISGTQTLNYGTGTVGYTYNGTTAQTTGAELPASITGTLTINNSNGVTLNSPIATAFLTLTAGILNTSSANPVTITGTTVGSLTGGSATAYINGPVARTLPASLATGTTYLFPVGKATYNPLSLVNPTTTAGGTVVIKTEAFDANCGGTAGSGLSLLNTDRYWNAEVTNGGSNFTDTKVRLADASATIAANKAIGQSATSAGTYSSLGGLTVADGVITSFNTTTTLPSQGFFVLGNKAPMVYVSSTTEQPNTGLVAPAAVDQDVIRIQVVTSGADPAISVTSVSLTTLGSTNPAADITNAKLYYTGSAPTFNTTTLFGTQASPNGPFTISGSQVLTDGVNYFWLAYDIASGATSNNVVDATCESITVAGTPQTPTVTNPDGNRTIFAQFFFEPFETTWTVPGTLTTTPPGAAWSSGSTSTANEWHRNDYTTGWSWTSGGSPSVNGANSTTYYSRFHTYGISSPGTGDLITPAINFSPYVGSKYLNFYYINPTGSDVLNVYFSTDGGSTWSSTLSTLGVAATWTPCTIPLGPSVATSVKIKFIATSDYGNDDIGLDEVNVNMGGSPNMKYLSSTTNTASTLPVKTASLDNEIIGIQIMTQYLENPLNVTQLDFNTNGSTNPVSDITNATVYYTGSSAVFDKTTLFGTTPNPNGSFIVTGSQTLSAGVNYFWLTYDVPGTATPGNVLDGECNFIWVGGEKKSPTVQAPSGNRVIKAPLSGVYTINNTLPTGGANFTNFDDALLDLNYLGISGPVTFNVSAGQTFSKTCPAYPNNYAYALITTGTASNPIVFQRFGTGANPVISVTGTSDYYDIGMWLYGVDYVTFNGIDISDAGTSSSNYLDQGYYLQGPADNNCNHITIKNCTIDLNKLNTYSTGIYAYSNAPTASANANSYNTFLNITVQDAYQGIYLAGLSAAIPDVGNYIGTEGAGTSTMLNLGNSLSTTIYGIYGNYQNDLTVNNTTVSNLNGTGTLYGIYLNNTANSIIVSNNTVSNLTGNVSHGIYLTSAGNNITVSSNIISTLASSSTSSAMYGLYYSPLASASATITGNTISGLTALYTVQGMYIAAGLSNAISKNKIYNVAYTGSSSYIAYGLNIAGGTTNNIYNNYIYDIKAPASTGTPGVRAINLGGGTSDNLAYNTVYLDYTSTAASNQSACLYATVTPSMIDLKNNIFVNKSDMTTGTRAVAFYKSSTSLTNLSFTTNNNLYYAGSPGTKNLIFYDATNSDQTLSAYTSRVAPRESNSVTELPPFISPVSPYDLHLSTTSPSQAESGGVIISSPVAITDDYDANPRYPNPGYPDNPLSPAKAPDIGADEFAGLLMDITPPVITYNPLMNTASQSNRLLVATITDLSGVPVSGTGLPVLYWKINSGSYIPVQGTYLGSNQYQFQFGAGVVENNIVSYYVVAQDLAAVPNVTSFPLTGASGFSANPPACSTPTSTPSTYTIVRTFPAGNYWIGGTGTTPSPGCDYVDITAAFADMTSKELNGPVTFILTSTYNSAEEDAFPVVLNTVAGASSINTVKIKPDVGTSPVITGSSTSAVLKLNGIDYFTIDGSNNGTTTRNLTISNSNSGTSSAVIWLANASLTNGATNNIIKNCLISGNGATTTLMGIYAGGNASVSTTVGPGIANSNNVYQNNAISKAQYGIFLLGPGATNLETGTQVIGNNLGSSVAADGFSRTGIDARYQNGLLVASNDVQNIFSGLNTVIGINIQEDKNSTISANKVHYIGYNGAFSQSVYGINTLSSSFFSLVDPSANTHVNNLVFDLTSSSASTSWNVSGINNNGGYGDKYYFNSVALTGSLSGTSGTGGSACFSNGNGFATTYGDALDVRNNVFYMNGTSVAAATLYAHYTSCTSYTLSSLNYNDLFSGATTPALAKLGYFNGAAVNDLAAWKTATGQEANSISNDPFFVSAIDLTPTHPALNGTATPIAGITTDYNGVTRSVPPDMGAIEFVPSTCFPPTGFYITSLAGNSATINWLAAVPAPGTGYDIYYSTLPTPPGPSQTPSASVGQGVLSYPITNLASTTTYYVWVRSNCGSGTSVWSTRVSFTTLCGAISTFPYYETFSTSTIPPCWSNVYVSGTTNWSYVTTNGNSTITPRTGAYMAQFLKYNFDGDQTKLVTPQLNLSLLNNPRLTFYYANVNWSGDIDELRVFYKTSAAGTWTQIGDNYTEEHTTWTKVTLILPDKSSDYYIAFEATSNYAYGLDLDDITIEETPTCIEPTDPFISNLQSNAATLNWTASVSLPPNGYEWEVRTSGAPGSGAPGLAASGSTLAGVTTANATGLTAATQYYAYVRAHCVGSDFSAWTSATVFTTACNVFALPFAEHFQTTTLPNCWSMSGPDVWKFITTWPDYGASGLTDHTGTGGSFAGVDGSSPYPVSGVTLLSPLINVSSTSQPQLRFYLFNNNTNTGTVDWLSLRVDLWNGTAWTEGIYLWDGTMNDPNWVEVNVPLSGYSITGPIQLKFVVEKSSGSPFYDDLIIDDVYVEATPVDPALTVSPLSINCGYAAINTYTAEQTYNLSGVRLTGYPGNIAVTAPPNFQVSLTSGGPFSNTVNVPYSSATLPATPIYVRCGPTAVFTPYSGIITHVGGGAFVNEAVSGTSVPNYCVSAATSTSDEEIWNVTIGSLNNSSTCSTTGGAGSLLNRYSNYAFTVSPPVLMQGTGYPFSVTIGQCNSGNKYRNAVKIFIDYNQDGDFDDPSEEVFMSDTNYRLTYTYNGDILIPTNASQGNTMMRVVNKETADPTDITPCGTYGYGETEDYLITIMPQAMTYVSSATSNNGANVTAGSTHQMIVGLQVVTTGSNVNPLLVTSITANASGTTNIADISNARVYYTGQSPDFALVNQFGSVVAGPTLTDFTISGSQPLSSGTNYFWLTYDISPTATEGNHVAALIPGITIGTEPKVPTPGTPGYRTIVTPLSGTITVGTGGTYPTFTNDGGLFQAINSKGLSGDLVANVISDISIENGTHALNQWSEAGTGGYGLMIQPSAATLRTVSGSYDGALFRLYGADRVTINGSYGDVNQLLAFANNQPSTGAAVFSIGSTPQDGATNNTIMNCAISGNAGNTTKYAIVTGSGATLGASAEVANSYNEFSINTIVKCQYGIAAYGKSGNETGLMVYSNIIGSADPGSKLGVTGILLSNQTNATVTNNSVMGIAGSSSTVPVGIRVSGTAGNIEIRNNDISDVKNTANYSSIGIALNSTSTAANVKLINNLIFDIAGYGFNSMTTDNGYGINIMSGGGYTLWFNSVNLATNQTLTNGKPACLLIGSAVTTAGSLDIRNNIFSIPATIGADRYAMICNAANTVFSSINYNDYFTSGTNLGYIGGTNRATLAAWQAGTGQDANSLNIDPAFVSATNLHTAVPAINNAGLTISGVVTDYANVVRTSPPDMGAYEFNLPITSINTLAATNVNQMTTEVHGNIATNGEVVNLFFEYGLTTGYGMTSPAVPVSARSLTTTTFDKILTGLLPNSTYHFRAKGVSTTSAEIIYGQDMTFTTLPLPIITGPADVCVGAFDQVYATETGKFDYAWTISGGGTITSGQGTNSILVTWSETGTYSLTVSYSNTSGGPLAPSLPYMVEVHPILAVSLSITPSENPVCTGAPVTFTALPVNGGDTPAFQWKVNGVDAGVNSPTFTYIPLNNDVVSCVLTSSELCTTGNPATSNEITMTVNAPSLPVSVTVAPSQSNVCLGTLVTFTATPVNGGNAPAYEWKVNGVTAGTSSPTYSYIPANGDAVLCILTSNDYCGIGSPATSNTVIMTVNDPDPVSVTIMADVNPSCESALVTFTATPVNGGSAPTYQWKVNGDNTGTNSPVLGYFPVDGDVFTCVMTSNQACITGNPATSNQVTMEVTPLRLPSVTIVESDNDVCAGTQVTFTATPLHGGANPTYQWKVNGNNVGTNLSQYSYSPANGDDVTCVMTSDYPCPTANPVTSNTVTMIVNPLNPVSVTIVESANYICEGSLISYSAMPVNGGSAPVFQWKVNGVNAGTNSPVFDYVPVNNDVITCVLTSNISCPSGNPATSNAVTMNVSPNVTVAITIAPSVNPVCAGMPVSFSSSTVNGGAMPQYQWKVNGLNAGTNSPLFTYTPSNGDQVKCVLISSIICTEENPVTSNTVNMNVQPVLPVSVSIVASANPVCPGATVSFTATPVNGGPSPAYQWKVNGVNAGANNPVFAYIPAEGDIVTCVLTSSGVCVSGNPATSNAITMNLSQQPVPVITGASTVVAGTTGVVYSTQAGQTNYLWAISPGGVITSGGTATDHTATVTWNTVGAQWISVNYTDAQTGCSGAQATVYNVTVSSGVPADRIVQNVIVTDGQVVCYDATNTITVAGGTTHFIVQNGGSATFIAGNNILYLPGTMVEAGGYMLGKITTTGEYCGVLPPAMITTAVEETTPVVRLASVRLYPNPTRGTFIIEQSGTKQLDMMKVEIFSMVGEKILDGSMTGVKKQEFTLSDIPAGIYFVRISGEEMVETIKLIKH